MYISSDTNIWFDFYEIHHLDHPFRLEHEFYISKNAFSDELPATEDIRDDLLRQGLKVTEITDDELVMAKVYSDRYRALSIYDAIALSIAKSRNWILLTGDKPLRIAAEKEIVQCHGIIWIYDELRNTGRLSETEFHSAISDLIEAVRNGGRRLPMDELENRQGNGT